MHKGFLYLIFYLVNFIIIFSCDFFIVTCITMVFLNVCVCVCVCVCARSQSYLTLCNRMDYSPPSSSVHGIFQARILQYIASSFFRGSSRPRDQTHLSCAFCVGRWVLCQLRQLGKPIFLHEAIMACPVPLLEGVCF